MLDERSLAFFRWNLKGKQGKRIRGECASNVITGDDSICVGSNVQ
jgi:hypothetical protein